MRCTHHSVGHWSRLAGLNMAGLLAFCANSPALQGLEQEGTALPRQVCERHCEVGYWKSRHADAVQRVERLQEELAQAQGRVRTLQGKLFGRKPEESGASDRSHELFDPEEVAVGRNRRGAPPGHRGHPRLAFNFDGTSPEEITVPRRHISHGGLDANWLTAHGIATVTLRTGAANAHTTSEHLGWRYSAWPAA